MKKIIVSLVLGLSFSLGLAQGQKPVEINSIAAIVGEDVITQLQLDERVDSAKIQIQQQVAAKNMRMPSNSEIQKQILNEMILTKLELQRAEDLRINVSTAELNQQVANIAKEQNITVAQLYKKAADSGLRRNAYREELKDQMIIHKLIERVVVPKVTVSDNEVDLYLASQSAKISESKEYQVKNILIPNKTSEPTTKELQQEEAEAKALLKEINSGKTSFDQAAFSHSTGEHSLEGGDLGWRKAAELPAVFVKALVNMQAGDVAGPIQAGNGFHLIKLVAVRDTNKPLTKAQVKDLLFKRKVNDALSRWQQGLRSTAYVKVLI